MPATGTPIEATQPARQKSPACARHLGARRNASKRTCPGVRAILRLHSQPLTFGCQAVWSGMCSADTCSQTANDFSVPGAYALEWIADGGLRVIHRHSTTMKPSGNGPVDGRGGAAGPDAPSRPAPSRSLPTTASATLVAERPAPIKHPNEPLGQVMITPEGWTSPVSTAPRGGARKLGAARRFLHSTPKGRAWPGPAPRGGARKLGAARRFLVRTPYPRGKAAYVVERFAPGASASIRAGLSNPGTGASKTGAAQTRAWARPIAACPLSLFPASFA